MDYKSISHLVRKFKSGKTKVPIDMGHDTLSDLLNDSSNPSEVPADSGLPLTTVSSECLQNRTNEVSIDKLSENTLANESLLEKIKDIFYFTTFTFSKSRNDDVDDASEDTQEKIFETHHVAVTFTKEADPENIAHHLTTLIARLDRLESRLLQVTRIQSLTDLIRQLYVAFDSGDMEVARVRFLMESYASKMEDWKQYAKFNKDRYTRNLVDEGNGRFNLILLCWSQGQISSVHDHSQAHCFMKMLQGSLTEVRYENPNETKQSSEDLILDQPLSETSRTELNENDVCYINDSIGLHKVGNTGPHPGAVSLHLYSPPFDMCSSFDALTGQKSSVKMTFWSKFGEDM